MTSVSYHCSLLIQTITLLNIAIITIITLIVTNDQTSTSETQTEECSYLLAADVLHKHFSIVLSPNGVTLMTGPETTTIGWDKQVYTNGCKTGR